MRSSHARRFVPGVNERQLRNARAYVSCIRSSASSREPTRCRATRKTWSDRSSASSSKRTRSRASSAMRLASVCVGSLMAATLTNALVFARTWVESFVFPRRSTRKGGRGHEGIRRTDDRRRQDRSRRRHRRRLLHRRARASEVEARAADGRSPRSTTTQASCARRSRRSLIHDSPKVNGEIDRAAIAEHYGLAEGFTDPPTRGLGDVLSPTIPRSAPRTSVQDRDRGAQGGRRRRRTVRRRRRRHRASPAAIAGATTRRTGLNRPEAGAAHLLEERIQRGALLVVARASPAP